MSNLPVTVATTISGVSTGGTIPGCPTGTQCFPNQVAEGSNGLGIGTSSGAFAPLAAVLIEVLAIASMAALVGIIVIAIVANRADPDPTGHRPQSVYFFVVSFVTITTSIVGSALVVAALLWQTANHPPSASHSIARLLLLSALVFAVSVGLFVIHLRRGLTLARAGASASNPSLRVGQSYVSVVAFVSVLALLVTGILTIYLIFAIAAPGTFGSFGGRSASVRLLVESVYLAAVAMVVIWTHGSLLTPRLGILARRSDPTTHDGAPPTTVPLA